MADRVGEQLGNYRLLRLLGEGGFADVYLGEHIHLKTQAAIKVSNSNLSSKEIEQFRYEARNLASLEHPHIVRVLEFGIQNKVPYIVMSYAPNGSLRDRHPEGTKVSLTTILGYVKQVASALQYAHDEKKLVHRDIKPANILLGRQHEVLLSDFGLAILTHSYQKSAQTVIGSVLYMSPEQIKGAACRASDQYSLGIAVYEWLTGTCPFNGSLIEIITQHITVLPPPFKKDLKISPQVEQAVMKALAKDPQDRYPSVTEFATALGKEVVFARLIIDTDLSNRFPPGVYFNLSPQTTIGRNRRNTIVLPYEIIGDEDTFMWEHNGRWYVKDVGGVHSTWVNDQPCRNLSRDNTLVARYGDYIFIGTIKFKLSH